MTDAVAEGARTAAQRLAAQHGNSLIADVETALHIREAIRPPDQYVDPVALGALIVSVAQLAWTIYADFRTKTTNAPSTEVVTRAVRTEFRQTRTITSQTDEIISVTVQETMTVLCSQRELQ
jgi:hypothetical protein